MSRITPIACTAHVLGYVNHPFGSGSRPLCEHILRARTLLNSLLNMQLLTKLSCSWVLGYLAVRIARIWITSQMIRHWLGHVMWYLWEPKIRGSQLSVTAPPPPLFLIFPWKHVISHFSLRLYTYIQVRSSSYLHSFEFLLQCEKWVKIAT